MIGTSSSSSTEAWLVHPEPDIWLALSASITLGLDGASLAAPGEEGAAGADEQEEEEEAAASAADEEEPEGAAAAASGAAAPATSLRSLLESGKTPNTSLMLS